MGLAQQVTFTGGIVMRTGIGSTKTLMERLKAQQSGTQTQAKPIYTGRLIRNLSESLYLDCLTGMMSKQSLLI